MYSFFDTLLDLVSQFIGVQPSLLFGALLVPHVLAGMTCVASGAVAMLSKKGRGRHPRFGDIYYWGLLVVFLTATGMSLLRWPDDAYLFVLGALSFGSASVGFAARKLHRRGWTTFHIVGMGVSYIVLLTAFYVDNGPRLPVYDRLPVIVFWTVPTLVGLPLVARALARHKQVSRDSPRSGANSGGIAPPTRDLYLPSAETVGHPLVKSDQQGRARTGPTCRASPRQEGSSPALTRPSHLPRTTT